MENGQIDGLVCGNGLRGAIIEVKRKWKVKYDEVPRRYERC